MLSRAAFHGAEKAGVRVYHLAPGAWAAAVGRKIAAHTRPVWLENGRLVVEVEDAVWQAQLTSLCGQILGRLRGIVGENVISWIEFRVVPPRRAPKRAGEADEADAIADPVMRRLYLTARRKATG